MRRSPPDSKRDLPRLPASERRKLIADFPLRQLRKLLGYPRHRFASLVGCSEETIKATEYGKNSLTADLARKIMLATGVHPMSLLEGTRYPVDLRGQKYTPAAFADWRARQPTTYAELTPVLDPLLGQLRLALAATASKGRLFGAVFLLREFVQRLLTDFDVEPAYRRLLSEQNRAQGKKDTPDLGNAAAPTSGPVTEADELLSSTGLNTRFAEARRTRQELIQRDNVRRQVGPTMTGAEFLASLKPPADSGPSDQPEN